MATAPRFTILCATYNQAEYLEEMLDSALAQTLADFEVVVVDDGSTDATPEVLERFLAALPADQRAKVVVERTENGGQTAAFEHGFSLSRGAWISLLDSDDRFHPGKLAEVDRAIRDQPEVGMVMHPLAVVDAAGRGTGLVRPRAATMSHGDVQDQMRRQARHVAPGTSGLTFRRDVLAQLFPAPTKGFSFAADAYLSFGAAVLAPIAALPTPLADYRMQPQGQYFKRMLSADGLRRQIAFQDVIAGHFGLLAASRRNSHWARNRYASAMLDGPWARRLQEFWALQRSVATDPHFSLKNKVVLVGFWSVTLVAGPRAFPHLWGWFQRRQTGWHRVVGSTESGSAPEDRPAGRAGRETRAVTAAAGEVANGSTADAGRPEMTGSPR